MTRTLTSICTMLLLASSTLLTACGYTQTELFDTQYQTVATPIFENKSFERDVEFQLTEALTKELELRTPYKVVNRTTAETVLSGTITSVRHKLLSRTFEGGIAQEIQLIVNVSYEWKDTKTGKVIRKRGQLSGTGEYLPARGTSEPIEVAKHQAVAEIARDLVSSLRKDW